MTETSTHPPDGDERKLAAEVGAKEARKLAARRRPHEVWLGLGMMGLVGWSVVTPTLIGAGLGLWLDGRRPGTHRWTLALLVAGLIVGCAAAWHWVAKEMRAIRRDDDG